MRKSWLMCLLAGALAGDLGQAATVAGSPVGNGPVVSQAQAPTAPAQAPAAANPTVAEAPAADVAPASPVLTIKGVCPAPSPKAVAAAPGTKSPAASKDSSKTSANCKTVVTRAEFEKMASAVSPTITPQLKRQLVTAYPRLLVMSQAAERRGLQNTPQYKENMKLARMQILTNALQRNIQEESAKVSDQDIGNYYTSHSDTFEQYSLSRLYIPRMKQMSDDADAKEGSESNEKDAAEAKQTEEQLKAKQEQMRAREEQGEQEMTKLAEALRARAASGEDFTKLQKEAFEASGMKVESPTVAMPTVRRTGLPPAHAAVFAMKPGDVSAVLSDTGGHYIYKLVSETQLPLEQAKEEIHSTLQNQRLREAMDKYQNSFKTETNEAYFGSAPPGVNRQPPPRTPHPAPSGAEGQTQQPPPAAQKPD